jgi:oxygen-independent coproporphyrinogen-3 oxidase
MHGLTTATMFDLLKRYDRQGPRYASYPTAVEFHQGISEVIYRDRLVRADMATEQWLSLDVHLPFCEAKFAFRACNAVITGDPQVARRDLDVLDTEIDHTIEVTSVDRLFIRNVCTVFDRYHRARLAGARPLFSRTV